MSTTEHYFTDDEISKDPILKFFDFYHLAPDLQAVSRRFAELAEAIVHELPRSAERTVSLRKLLESKDAAVRSAFP